MKEMLSYSNKNTGDTYCDAYPHLTHNQMEL